MERGPRHTKQELWARFEKLVAQLLQDEEIPPNERFNGLILAMRAHGLPCDPRRLEGIRRLWNECVAARQRRRKKT